MRRINEGVKKLERKAKALSKKVKSYTDATWSQDEETRKAAFKARAEAQKKAVAAYQRLGRKQAEGSMRPLTRAEEASKKLMPSTPENLKDRLMRKHGHKLKKKKVNELKKSLDSRNTLTRAQLDKESPEFKVSNVSKKKAEKGRGVNLSRKTMDTVDNTDASPKYVDATGNTKFARLKGWAKQMKDNRKDRKARRRVYNQVKSNTDEPSIIASKKDGSRHLVAGNTRATLRSTLGKPIKAHVFKEERNKLKTESSRTVKTAKKKLATMRDLTPREKKAMQKQFKRKPGKLDSLAGKLGSENVGRVYT